MHIEVDRLVEPEARARLAAGIERVLGDVRAVTADWKQMLARLIDVVSELDGKVPEGAQAELAESRGFVEWLAAGNFLLLGYRRHDLVTENGEDALRLCRTPAWACCARAARRRSPAASPPCRSRRGRWRGCRRRW